MTAPDRSATHAAHATNRSATLADALFGAAELLNAVIHGRTLDSALAASPFTGAARAAAMDLAYSTLRDFGRGDFLLSQLMTSPVKDAAVRGLLLAALTRLEARPEDAHTTVDQAVGAAARIAGGNFKGLTNGVLRSFERRADTLCADADANETARWRHPGWWQTRVRKDHPDAWQAILSAGNMRPPMALRVNHRRVSSVDFLATLTAAGIAGRISGNTVGKPVGNPADNTAILLDKPLPVDRIPGFGEGLCSVQDPGAQLATGLLDCADGMRVLDACAAPGSKTAHLLERHELDLLALDADAGRATRINENLTRLGLCATVRVEDCRDVSKWWDGQPFDRILADVPCTASGVVRRHPDAKWLRRAGDVAQFARTQVEIMDSLWRTLAPGGKMLYATCSVFSEENTRQVAAFVGRHADALRLPTIATSIDGSGAALELHLLPDGNHDGFFYALLQKR
jgi:16S rRNA (cytosine967-C5)-methyltransferase